MSEYISTDTLLYILLAILTFWGGCLWFFPIYGVWSAHKRGEADLARAKNEQQIQVAQADGRLLAAKANKEATIIEEVAEGEARLAAAKANKEAAIVEAEAVAAQISCIGGNLQKHDLYLKWQWIKMMEETDNTTIYVPTEAGLPILEAGRRRDHETIA